MPKKLQKNYMYTKTNLRNFKQDTKSSNNSIQKNTQIKAFFKRNQENDNYVQ